MNDTSLAHTLAITQRLARFANCFDLKDWAGLGDCLADTVHTDYSALRGTPPETMTRERFVTLRREALHGLRTQHLGGNADVTVDGERANARLSMVIYRQHPDGQRLDTHCLYHFGMQCTDGNWRINAITQQVFWSDGNRAIHAGIVAQNATN